MIVSASTTLTPEEISVAKVRLVLAEFIFLTTGEINGVFKKHCPKNFPFFRSQKPAGGKNNSQEKIINK